MQGLTSILRGFNQHRLSSTSTCFISFFAWSLPVAFGAGYYVSPTGDDASSGSFGAPWRTVQRAANGLLPGDTVYVRSGVYFPPPNQQQVVQIIASGTALAPITFRNYENEVAILEATSGTTRRSWSIYVNGADHIRIQGFELRGGKRGGIRLTDSDYFVVSDCRIHDVRDTSSVNIVVGGIVVLNSFSVGGIIQRNEVYDCSNGMVVRNEGGAPILDTLVERNYIHDIHWWNAGLTFNNKNADGLVLNTTINSTVRRNVIARCGDDGIDCYDSDECTIEQNTVYNMGDVLSGAPATANGDGNGIKVSTGGGGGHLIRQNIAFNSERSGFDQDHVEASALGNSYYNNVSFGNGRDGWIIERASATPTVLRNNISFSNNQAMGGFRDIRVVSAAMIDSDYNFWADFSLPTGEGVNSLSGNPMFHDLLVAGEANIDAAMWKIDLNVTWAGFGRVPAFTLLPSSRCVNTGAQVALPYLHEALDRGAYESPW